MIHKEIVELWRKHQEVHEFAQAVEAIVRADEREACAQVCDAFESDSDTDAGAVLAAAIRARGQA
jgi:hypothetical protein